MEVIILTRPDCAFCDQAKQILTRLSEEYPISISTLDLDSVEGRALAMRGGVMFPPGIFIDGEAFSYGRPSEKKLRQQLEGRLKAVNGR